MREGNNATVAPCRMTPESIDAYIRFERERGASQTSIRKFKRFTDALFAWLPEDKLISKDRLLAWRQSLKDHGYSRQTELNYIKCINRYLDYMGCSDARFNRGRAKDIAGKQFGYLTAIEPTGEKHRNDLIWKCRCKCGKEVEYPATRLLLGNTVSCGCLRGAHFQEANKYIGGTSLRQSLEEQVYSSRAASGYTGVTTKHGKWQAYIRYKGQNISLGCYTALEDAVKARARGKELVQKDALGLLDFYEALHRDDPALPSRSAVRAQNRRVGREAPAAPGLPALRSDNTSGYPGVYPRGEKWAARITYRKITYHLGVYGDLEGALAARRKAEAQLREDPAGFPAWMERKP